MEDFRKVFACHLEMYPFLLIHLYLFNWIKLVNVFNEIAMKCIAFKQKYFSVCDIMSDLIKFLCSLICNLNQYMKSNILQLSKKPRFYKELEETHNMYLSHFKNKIKKLKILKVHLNDIFYQLIDYTDYWNCHKHKRRTRTCMSFMIVFVCKLIKIFLKNFSKRRSAQQLFNC